MFATGTLPDFAECTLTLLPHVKDLNITKVDSHARSCISLSDACPTDCCRLAACCCGHGSSVAGHDPPLAGGQPAVQRYYVHCWPSVFSCPPVRSLQRVFSPSHCLQAHAERCVARHGAVHWRVSRGPACPGGLAGCHARAVPHVPLVLLFGLSGRSPSAWRHEVPAAETRHHLTSLPPPQPVLWRAFCVFACLLLCLITYGSVPDSGALWT